METERGVSCYITAGGKASRMSGAIKAFIEIDGQRIIDKNLKVINSIFSEVGIITNNKEKFAAYAKSGLRLVSDEYKDIGPLAGIHAAMASSNSYFVFILASDMPNISKSLMLKLISIANKTNADAVIPTYDGKIEPLFAVFKKSTINTLQGFIESGESYAVRGFLKIINVEFYDVSKNDERFFRNINYQKDIILK